MLRSHLKVGNGSDLGDGSDLRDAGYTCHIINDNQHFKNCFN